MIIGIYDHYGYQIESDGRELYMAGNHRLESTAIVERDSHAALPLTIIRKFCRQTAREFAAERAEPYGGIERNDGWLTDSM